MKKVLLFSLICSVFAATAFSANFAPTVLKLNVASTVAYKFDGSTLTIPVTVTGVPADVSFLVFTKGKGTSVSKITNGYLGWHYVNKIDTCLYMSASNALVIGSNNISWNGKDKAGTAVAKGDYTFYMFGYDNKSTKVKMTSQISPSPWVFRTILEKDSMVLLCPSRLCIRAMDWVELLPLLSNILLLSGLLEMILKTPLSKRPAPTWVGLMSAA